MSGLFGKKQDFVIMSPFKATITHEGKILKSSKVRLNYSWNTDKTDNYDGYDRFFVTDENGIVEMPMIVEKIFVSQVQPTVSNYKVEVEVGSQPVKILIVSKKDPTLNGEFGEELGAMTCEITDPLMHIEDPRWKTTYLTKCDWQGKDKWETFEP